MPSDDGSKGKIPIPSSTDSIPNYGRSLFENLLGPATRSRAHKFYRIILPTRKLGLNM